jgi:hypothetical protein
MSFVLFHLLRTGVCTNSFLIVSVLLRHNAISNVVSFNNDRRWELFISLIFKKKKALSDVDSSPLRAQIHVSSDLCMYDS